MPGRWRSAEGCREGSRLGDRETYWELSGLSTGAVIKALPGVCSGNREEGADLRGHLEVGFDRA